MAGLRRLSTGVSYTPRGAMQFRVSLLRPNPSRDAEGEYLPPTVFTDSWASIISLQGRDLEKAQQIVSEVTHKIAIPYIDGMQTNMLVKFGPKVLQILYFQDPDERKVELQLFCIERNDGAIGEQ